MDIIQTIKQNCRRCYTCVRDCPAKAIRIVDGQASVVPGRCIGCGNCTVVCTQGAKACVSGVQGALELLRSGERVAAMLAPSFPADLAPHLHKRLVGALRQAGFSLVVEVAYGADLVGQAYRKYLEHADSGIHVVTACPAVVEYVRKYTPRLVPSLIPIVSPMIATAAAVHEIHGDDVRCVFIGPCMAKKLEAQDPGNPHVVDEVLTFEEMHRLFACTQVELARAPESELDPPRAGLGRVFPLVGGLLKCAGKSRSVLSSEVIVVNGPQETIEVLGHLEDGFDGPPIVEAMMCRGCFSGPGMSGKDLRLVRKRRVTDYVNAQLAAAAQGSNPPIPDLGIDLQRSFSSDDHRLEPPTEKDIRVVLARTNKFSAADELNCGACGYPTCRDKAIAVHHGLAEEAMCLPFMIEQAERVCQELHMPSRELRDVHRHLINTEKLASLGQMAAGIAHELNNPLGAILLYTHILGRKLQDRGDLAHDLALLRDESQRCKSIISMLLDFARQNQVRLEGTRLAELIAEVVQETSYLVQDATAGQHVEVEVEAGLEADVDRGQLTQALGNLVKNAVEAMDGKAGTVRVSAKRAAGTGSVLIAVSDEGSGIRAEDTDKLFQPFFTTKAIGRGTGLGLPITYGIVKMHRGRIWFENNEGGGATFFIDLPATQAVAARSILNGSEQDHRVRG